VSETTKPDPLACTTAMEAAVFRVGQVARRLLADHPELPVWDLEPSVWVLNHGSAVSAKLEISPGTLDGVLAWGTALGVEVSVELVDRTPYAPYRAAKFVTEVDGVQVDVNSTGAASDEETAAWRAEQDQALVENPVAAGGAQ
jgi:hypothetical protein